MTTRLYLEMAGECIDRLEPDERDALDTGVFTKILQICAEVAEGHQPERITPPAPPAMTWVFALYLVPGDRVWQDDVSFRCVESLTIETDGVWISWIGSIKPVRLERHQMVLIGRNRSEADHWNIRRSQFNEATINALAAEFCATGAIPR
jgi:hypothetical protein